MNEVRKPETTDFFGLTEIPLKVWKQAQKRWQAKTGKPREARKDDRQDE